LQDIAFLAVAVVAAVVAWGVRDLERVRRWLLGATGVALIGLPLIRVACGGLGWVAAWRTGISAVLAVDIALLVSGVACLWASRARGVMSSTTDAVTAGVKSSLQPT
jgi:hypothetical protein